MAENIQEVLAEADQWLDTHRVNDTWRTMSRLRDALVRQSDCLGEAREKPLPLKWVREHLGVRPSNPTAMAAWTNARYQEISSTPPRGVPVFFEAGRAAHPAISISDGYVLASLGSGKVTGVMPDRRSTIETMTIKEFEETYGVHYLGWTRDLNGVLLWKENDRG